MRNAVRFVKEAGVDAVKLEGAGQMLGRVEAIVGAGVPVMGHVGLTPQSATMLGGYRAQGRTAKRAQQLVDDAVALERAGCFSVVSSACPRRGAPDHRLAHRPDDRDRRRCGLRRSGSRVPRHAGPLRGPLTRFVKRYAELAAVARDALERYAAEVRSGAFPDEAHSYAMPANELALFEQGVR